MNNGDRCVGNNDHNIIHNTPLEYYENIKENIVLQYNLSLKKKVTIAPTSMLYSKSSEGDNTSSSLTVNSINSLSKMTKHLIRKFNTRKQCKRIIL